MGLECGFLPFCEIIDILIFIFSNKRLHISYELAAYITLRFAIFE